MNFSSLTFPLLLFTLTYFTYIGCSPPTIESPTLKGLEAQDIVGTWVADYSDRVLPDKQLKFAIETLVILNDGSYLQIFDNRKGQNYKSSPHSWRIEVGSKGVSVIVFENMRYFPDGIAVAKDDSKTFLERRLYPVIASSQFMGSDSRMILCFSDLDLNLCFEKQP